MNRTLARTIVNCLAMHGQSRAAFSRLRRFDLRDWQKTFAWLDLSGLALYFRQCVLEVDAQAVLPCAVLERLDENHADNRARVACMAEEFAQLNSLFRKFDVRYAALKGLALVPEYCPEANLRTQYDHDYLVDVDSMSRVEEALRQSGYRRKESNGEHPVVYLFPRSVAVSGASLQNLYSPDVPRRLEMHVRLWDTGEEKIAIGLPGGFLQRVRKRNWRGVEFTALQDNDALLHQVLHALHHMLHNWCRLAVFHEIAHFLRLRSNDEVFWKRYRERVENHRWLPEASGLVFSMAADLFGVPVPAAAAPCTTAALTPAMRLWIQRYGTGLALGNFRASKLSLFLQREFMEDAETWREVRRRRLLPVQRPHRVPLGSTATLGGRVAAHCAQAAHTVRRLAFHLSSCLRYGWESYWWGRAKRSREADVGEPRRIGRLHRPVGWNSRT